MSFNTVYLLVCNYIIQRRERNTNNLQDYVSWNPSFIRHVQSPSFHIII